MERKSIGQFIAALRKANGLTQKQLADKLNVSDKAVSRWERDETAPDISLIPVIADIFGVTCDELLCGERKINNEASSGDDEVLSAKGEKQRRRILTVGLSQYKNRSIISGAISAVGLIAALICNFAFYRAYIGFFIAILFYLAALVCQIIFVNKAFLSVADDEFSDTEIQSYKRSVVHIAEYAISAIFILIVITLPLIATPIGSVGAYAGIWAETWLFYSAIYGFAGLIICVIASNKINLSLDQKGTIAETDNDKKRRHNSSLGFICAAFLAVAVFITYGIYCGVTDGGYWPKFADGTVFEDYNSFAEFMEKDVPGPGLNYFADNESVGIFEDIEWGYEENFFGIDDESDEYADDESDEYTDDESDEWFDEYVNDFFNAEPYGVYEDNSRIVIKDIDGNIVVDCTKKNDSVVYIKYGELDDGFLPIKAVTADEAIEGQKSLARVNIAFVAVYAFEAGLALFVYFKNREKISK